MAAAALVLRWGPYLAVLLDGDNPLWPAVHSEETSRISDEEMARINIEASAALAEWIDLYRGDGGGRLYTQLVSDGVLVAPVLLLPAHALAPGHLPLFVAVMAPLAPTSGSAPA